MTQEIRELDRLSQQAAALASRLLALADDVEVWVTRRDVVSFAIENRKLAPELRMGRLQVALRALRGGQMAVAATTTLDEAENVRALSAALGATRATRLAGFSAHRIQQGSRAFDEALGELISRPERIQNLAATIRDRAFAAKDSAPHIEGVEGRVTAQTRWTAVATKQGTGAFVENVLSAYAEVNSARTEREIRREWRDDDETLLDLGARAVRSFPAEVLAPSDLGLAASAEVPALLEPSVVEALLRIPAHDHFLASSLLSKQTNLTPGSPIASPEIHLRDTSRPRALARDFDDELTGRDETVLIDGGRFRNFVTSRSSAMATGLPETGNGVRHPILAEDVNEAPVRDKLMGLEMLPGQRSSAELLSSLELAIIPRALLGIHGADRARTAFSATVADGLVVRNGRVAGQMAPGRWNVSGRVLPGNGERGLLMDAVPSSDREDTGSALLPHLSARLTVG